ncbi:hypothetical protein TRFO_30628 [Tritrichomonas foetus]|uniref:Importin N-terminal domain-containing protein n=1 Tax=Tritrichomonas foetus TaxID=1144522 RepID=A0A1J4JT21_9EUKA|nr:hypothetical protein TRFO_30628 [Tritrichomonas foetus]|eukprot:OHT02265.1 hypothetical protein TRFO_30628 [Tritrichomonas foetus]
MTNIAEIYSLLKIPSNEAIARATDLLTQIYQDPNTIPQFIEILKSHPDPFVRQQATIGLKNLLHNFWHVYSRGDSAEQIIQGIIQCLQNEPIEIIRHLIIHSIYPICSHREVSFSRILDDLYMSCIQSEEPAILDVGLRLYQIIFPHLDESTFSETLPQIAKRIDYIIHTKETLVITAASLITSLTEYFSSQIPDYIVKLVNLLFEVFKFYLMNNHNDVHQIANFLEKCIITGKFNSPKYLMILLDLANNPSISNEVLFNVFTPLSTLIIETFYELNDEFKMKIFATIFQCTANSFQDACIDDQSNSIYIFDTLYFISRLMEPEMILQALCIYISSQLQKPIVSPDQLFPLLQMPFSPHQVLSLLTIQLLIDEFPGYIAEILPVVIEFLTQQSNPTFHHSLREEAMICIAHLIDVINGGLIEYSNELIQPIINAISTDHELLITNGLTAITSLLTTLEFDHSLIPIIIQQILPKLKLSFKVLTYGTLALNALVFASGSDIEPFVLPLCEHFGKIIQMNEDSYPMLKSYPAEALSRLIKNVPSISASFGPQTIEILVQCASGTDLSLVGSVLSAIGILSDSQLPNIPAALQIALQKAFEILNLEFPRVIISEEEEEENETLPTEYEAKCQAINFINSLTKSHPEIMAQHTTVVELLANHVQCNENTTVIASMKALTTLAKLKIIDSAQVMSILMPLFEDDNMNIVIRAYRSFAKMIENSMPPEIIENCMKLCKTGFGDFNNFQQDGQSFEDGPEFLDSVFKLLAKIAQFYPNQAVLELILRFLRKHNPEITNLGSISLAYLYLAPTTPDDLKQLISNMIINSIPHCKGTLPPYSLIAANMLFRSGNPAILQYCGKALGNIHSIISSKRKDLIVSAVSLLFTLFGVMGEQFNMEFFNYMILSFPIFDKNEATHVYSSLLQLYQRFPNVLNQFAPQIIAALAKTVSQARHVIVSMRLPDDVFTGIINLLKLLLEATPNSSQIISETINNQISLNRLMELLK